MRLLRLMRLISALLSLTAAIRPMQGTDQAASHRLQPGNQLCCCHKTMAPVEICVKDTAVFAKVDFKNGFAQKPQWSNGSITVHETWEYHDEILQEDTWTKYFQLQYLGELEAPTGLGFGNPKFMDFYYTEYKHEEKKGRNAKGADTFNLCTDRKHECSCEFYDGKELKDCLENRVEHCSSTFDCKEWMKVNKCTLSTEQTMKLMHKNSNMRIGTCFDKKQLKTRMMMAQCPDGYEKCDCNNKC